MSFRLFGVPVTIRGFFWLSAVLLGLASSSAGPLSLWIALPLWVAVVFVSVLVHEMGHAFASMRHGLTPSITLHGMGGVTAYSEWAPLSRLDRALISLAGPAAGLVFGGLVFAVFHFLPSLPLVVTVVLTYLIWVNLTWSLFNLVPVFPFDGGSILGEALGPRRTRTAAAVSLGVAALLACVFAWLREPWGTVLFAMSAMQSWQRYTLPEGAVLVDPFTRPLGSAGPSPLRQWWLKLRLKRLEAQSDRLKGGPSARRRAGPPLRVIQGGGGDPPKDKRFLN
jgi:Zn-dependent protease